MGNKTLTLTNKSTGYVAFKVKTTAPKAYLVRPSSGTLGPKDHVEVQIVLQEQIERHRFLVEATAIESNYQVTREQWNEFSKDQIQDKKMTVALEERQGDDEAIANSSAPVIANSSVPGQPAESEDELRRKYQEVVQYLKGLEEKKRSLDQEIKELKLSAQKEPPKSSGWPTMYVVVTAVLAVFVAHAANVYGTGTAG